jgi:hypothetical protein
MLSRKFLSEQGRPFYVQNSSAFTYSTKRQAAAAACKADACNTIITSAVWHTQCGKNNQKLSHTHTIKLLHGKNKVSLHIVAR